jgi:hypothetical protein
VERVNESVQRNPSNTISSTLLITTFLNVTTGILQLCSYFCLCFDDNFTFQNILHGNQNLLRFCGAIFSQYAVSLNSQRYFTQTCLHEKQGPSSRKENARIFFSNIFNKKINMVVLRDVPCS